MSVNRIYEWSRLQPQKTAIVYNDFALDYLTFALTIEAARKFFEQQKLPVGRMAIVVVDNLVSAWVLIIALRAIGLNTISVKSVSEAQDLGIRDVACLVTTQPEQHLHNLNRPNTLGAKTIVVPATIRTDNLDSYQHRPDQFGNHIIFSSGTTAAYKKMIMNGAFEERRCEESARTWMFEQRSVYHATDFGVWSGMGFKAPPALWHIGATVIFDQRPDKWQHFFRNRFSSSFLMPLQLDELIRTVTARRPDSEAFDLFTGAGFLSMELANKAHSLLPGRHMHHFGVAELIAVPFRSFVKSSEDLLWFTPMPERTVEIVDEDGAPCAVDQEGELRISLTGQDCTSYLDGDEASARAFRGGFIYPGDMAVKRADGRVRVLGRTADLLNVRGSKIAAAPLEDAIRRELSAQEVCIFAGLDDKGVEEIVVAVQSDREITQSQRSAVASKLPAVQRVRFSVMKEFPRTEGGMRKTRRTVLRQMVFPKAN